MPPQSRNYVRMGSDSVTDPIPELLTGSDRRGSLGTKTKKKQKTEYVFLRLQKLRNKTLALDALWRTMGIAMQIITLCPSGQLQILNCWNIAQIWHNSSATQPAHSYFLEGMLFIPYTKNGAKSLNSYVQVSIHLGCICATPGNKWNESVNCKFYPWNIRTLLKIWKSTQCTFMWVRCSFSKPYPVSFSIVLLGKHAMGRVENT